MHIMEQANLGAGDNASRYVMKWETHTTDNVLQIVGATHKGLQMASWKPTQHLSPLE